MTVGGSCLSLSVATLFYWDPLLWFHILTITLLLQAVYHHNIMNWHESPFLIAPGHTSEWHCFTSKSYSSRNEVLVWTENAHNHLMSTSTGTAGYEFQFGFKRPQLPSQQASVAGPFIAAFVFLCRMVQRKAWAAQVRVSVHQQGQAVLRVALKKGPTITGRVIKVRPVILWAFPGYPLSIMPPTKLLSQHLPG